MLEHSRSVISKKFLKKLASSLNKNLISSKKLSQVTRNNKIGGKNKSLIKVLTIQIEDSGNISNLSRVGDIRAITIKHSENFKQILFEPVFINILIFDENLEFLKTFM